MNISESTTRNNCETLRLITNFDEFSNCYQYFFHINISASILTIILIVATVILNLLVIVFIKKNKKNGLSAFDQILLGHAIVDGLTGLVDVPFYHVYSIFKYWPLSPLSAKIWSSYDNSINTVTNLHMIYLSYSRLRAIKSPRSYSTEFLLKKPALIMAFIWLISFIIWTPIAFTFGLVNQSLIFNDSLLIPIFQLIFWFLPLLIILIISCMIFYELKSKNKTNPSTVHPTIDSNKSLFQYFFNFYIGKEALFAIIMSIYWIQWIIPSLINLIGYLTYIPIEDYSIVYWLTYTVCCTDAILLLLFNPNASFLRIKSNRISDHQVVSQAN